MDRRAPQGAADTADHRPGSTPGRWAKWIAAMALLVALGVPAAAAADDSGQQVLATVIGDPGSTSSASVGQLATTCPFYTQGSYDPDATFPLDTWAVGTLLSCLSPAIPRTPNTSVIVGSAQLSPGDLAPVSDFADPTEDPVIYSDGTNLHFERPSRGTDDTPAEDSEVVSAGAPLTLTVFTGPALTVTLTPSATSVAPGGEIGFTATVSGGQASDYAWDFAGAAPESTAPDPTVPSFAAGGPSGSYTVSLQATDPSTGAAGVATAMVNVTGTPPAAATTTTVASTAPAPATTVTTPSAGRGGRHGTGTSAGRGSTTPTRTTSASTTSTVSTSTTPPATGRTRTRTTTGHSETTSTAAASPNPRAGHRPRRPSPTVTPAPTRTSSPRTPAPRRSPTRHVTARHRTLTHRRTAAPSGSTVLVSGRLLADLTAVPLDRSLLAHPVRTTAASGTAASIAHAGPLTWPELAGALAVVAGLLGLGAGRELRGRTR